MSKSSDPMTQALVLALTLCAVAGVICAFVTGRAAMVCYPFTLILAATMVTLTSLMICLLILLSVDLAISYRLASMLEPFVVTVGLAVSAAAFFAAVVMTVGTMMGLAPLW